MSRPDIDKRDARRRSLARLLTAVHDPTVEPYFEGVDTHQLVKTALKAGLGGVLLQVCPDIPIELDIPQQNKLRKQATKIASDNFRARRGFKKVAEALVEAELPFMLLKGFAMNLSIYHRPDLRPMSDIDVLIHPSDAARVDRVLRECNCSPGRPLVRPDFFPRYYYATEYFIGSENSVRIDLHARPFRPLRYMQTVPRDAMWDGAKQATLDGVEVTLPSDENMLIHLAVHSAIHGHARLMWLYDIYRFVRDQHTKIDWDLVRRKAFDWRLTLPVRSALLETAKMFDCFELRPLAERINGPTDWRDRLITAQTPRDSEHPLAHLVTDILTAEGFRFRAGYLSAVLLPGAEHMREVYPWRHAGWLPLAHAWRFVRPAFKPLHAVSKLVTARTRLRPSPVETAAGSV